jgi:hypothetical protein
MRVTLSTMTDATDTWADRSSPAADESASSAARTIAVLSSDLMLALRLEAPARAAGCRLETISSLADLPRALAGLRPGLLVLDLADSAFPFVDTRGVIGELAPGARLLAFYPHVRADLASQARALGCDLLMPRSRFLSDPAEAFRAGLAALEAEQQ